eukprot:GAFH01004807.1.p2 GENE.GAFH01004807.1~~GAFH01004807.1.p2  ORF type:complete len:85 (+),score=10.62 GAFH01004807.1:111-365(+)
MMNARKVANLVANRLSLVLEPIPVTTLEGAANLLLERLQVCLHLLGGLNVEGVAHVGFVEEEEKTKNDRLNIHHGSPLHISENV